eukprot:3095934-Rhodomonas_salina.2
MFLALPTCFCFVRDISESKDINTTPNDNAPVVLAQHVTGQVHVGESALQGAPFGEDRFAQAPHADAAQQLVVGQVEQAEVEQLRQSLRQTLTRGILDLVPTQVQRRQRRHAPALDAVLELQRPGEINAVVGQMQYFQRRALEQRTRLPDLVSAAAQRR